jgi:hypothetical protein
MMTVDFAEVLDLAPELRILLAGAEQMVQSSPASIRQPPAPLGNQQRADRMRQGGPVNNGAAAIPSGQPSPSIAAIRNRKIVLSA